MGYRMKDSLRTKYNAGEPSNREAVDAALGPDDEPNKAADYRYYRLREPVLPNSWYVHVSFDDKGKVVRFIISGD